jgi:hypothetical protein
MKTPSRSALACFLPLAALALGAAGCAGADEPEAWEAPPGYAHLGEFVAHINPKAQSITFERLPSKVADEAPGLGPQSIDEATITQDGVPNSGPADTLELVNNGSPGTNGSCPIGFQSNTFCGNITMRSFYAGRSLNNAYLQVTKVANTSDVDLSGHSGVNSDGSFGTLSNTLGLWKFTGTGAPTGVLGPSGSGANAGARDIVFANPDDATTKIYLHAYTTLTYGSYAQAGTDSSAFIDASTASGKVQVLKNGDGISPKTSTLPFAFTFYNVTYASGSTVTVNRYGGLGFGSQLGANTGANVALPSALATSFHPGVFAFWDDINYTTNDANSGVWVATTGSAPFRKFVVTWKTMKFTGDTNGTTALTFSMILNEGSDKIDFAYSSMTSSVKAAQAAGNSATIGVQNAAGNAATHILNVANSTTTGKGFADTTLP